MELLTDEEVEAFGYDAVHCAFGLSYAAYLVVPRVVLESMPARWQVDFVRMWGEMNDRLGHHIDNLNYSVIARDKKTGRIVYDELRDYRHHPRLLPENEDSSP